MEINYLATIELPLALVLIIVLFFVGLGLGAHGFYLVPIFRSKAALKKAVFLCL